MKKILIVFLLCSPLFIGCKKESIETKDENGAVIKKNYVWKVPLTENQWVWSGPVQVPIYQEKFLVATHFEANAKMAALNIFTGDVEWEWDDYIGRDQDEMFLHLHWPYHYENLLIFQKGSRSYCIDMENGQTVWKTEAEQSFQTYISGTGHEFLSTGTEGFDTLGYKIEYDYIGDVQTGERHPLPVPEFEIIDNTGQIGLRSTGGNLFEANNKSYFLSTYVKFAEHWVALPFFALYNRTDENWEYAEKQILPKHLRNGVSNFPVIRDDKIVTSVGYHICANDLLDRRQHLGL